MPDALPLQRPATLPKTWRGWFRSSIWLRVIAAILLIAAVSLFSLWRTRQAVWAVLIAGGTTSTIDRPAASAKQNSDEHVPEFAQPAWQQSGITIKEWLAEDKSVFGVNISHTAVDHQWLPHLASMTSLQILLLNQKQVGLELVALGKMSKLREVKVLNAGADTPLESLLSLASLERLTLVNPQGSIHGFAELGEHPSLRELDLSALAAESREWALLLRQCRNWSNVNKISIRSLFSLTPGLEALQSCHSLRTLEISAPVIHPDVLALSGIEQLTSLTINANRLDKEDLLLLRHLGNLRSLKVYSGGDVKLPLDELRQSLPDCQIEGGP